MLARKIVSATLSATLCGIVFLLILPYSSTELSLISTTHYILSIINHILSLILLSFFYTLIFSVLASILSDKIATTIASKFKHPKIEFYISLFLHLAIGIIASLFGLFTNVILFVTDRFMQRKNKQFTSIQALKSLAVPLVIFLLQLLIFYLGNLLV